MSNLPSSHSSDSIPITVPGFDAAGIASGIKKDGQLDLALVASPTPCRAAAVFTQNTFPAAPVLYDRRLLEFNPEGVHGVLINSGCANACTGVQGSANARTMAEWGERQLGCGDQTLFVMSTGVIGVQLPMDKLESGIPQVAGRLRPEGWEDAARAIMTTDKRLKLAGRTVRIGGAEIHLAGMAKGAGMIHPNMATMLSVVATDAHIAQPLLHRALAHAVAHSFNRISVDGDTSTNDTVLVLANGLAGPVEIVNVTTEGFQVFQAALASLCTELAQAVVRDGEGATRFVTIRVDGAADDGQAHRIANTVATSALVKTAFYGGDANWGRILCAVGYAGAQVEPERTALFVAGGDTPDARGPELQLVVNGTPADYREADAAAIFAQPEIDVRVDLGLGQGTATVWTTDLSHEYVDFNGHYRS